MDYAVELDQISKEYPGILALDSISFGVKKGSIHGFLGPNGAGKSTTMKIIVGLLSPTSGQLKFAGARPTIGYLPELPPLYSNMRVEEYLDFIAKINGNDDSRKNREVMERCGLINVGSRLVGNLSKGFKQRLGIAQTLVFDASLIILDEPLAGLDPASIQEIRSLIEEVAGEKTILFSSHQLHDVNRICSEITIINNGRIVESGPLDTLGRKFQSNQVMTVQLERWNDDLANEFQSQFQCESLSSEAVESTTALRIFLSGNEVERSRLSSFFVEKGCGLLSLAEEKIDLEEIFTLSMQEEER